MASGDIIRLGNNGIYTGTEFSNLKRLKHRSLKQTTVFGDVISIAGSGVIHYIYAYSTCRAGDGQNGTLKVTIDGSDIFNKSFGGSYDPDYDDGSGMAYEGGAEFKFINNSIFSMVEKDINAFESDSYIWNEFTNSLTQTEKYNGDNLIVAQSGIKFNNSFKITTSGTQYGVVQGSGSSSNVSASRNKFLVIYS